MFVTFERTEKKTHFASLNEKDISDNRKFLHTIKPFPSDKIRSRESLILVEKDKTIIYRRRSSLSLKNLEISTYNAADKLHHKFSNHSTLQAIIKYGNHPSIDAIKRHFKHIASSYFSKVGLKT